MHQPRFTGMGAVFLATYIALLAIALTLTISCVRLAETSGVKASSELEHVRHYSLSVARTHENPIKPRIR